MIVFFIFLGALVTIAIIASCYILVKIAFAVDSLIEKFCTMRDRRKQKHRAVEHIIIYLREDEYEVYDV